MYLPFLIHKDKPHPIKLASFVSFWNVSAFVCAVIFIFVVIFPQEGLQQAIVGRQVISTVTATYLQNLLRLYPNEIQLRLLLIEQEIGLDELDRAMANMQPLLNSTDPKVLDSVQWLTYSLNKQMFYSLPKNSPNQAKVLTMLQEQLRFLANKTKDSDQLLTLAQDAISFNSQDVAYPIFIDLFQNPNVPRGTWLIDAGKTALSLQHFKESSEFYLAAMQDSIETQQRREYYMDAVNSLIAGNMPEQAYQLATIYYESDFADKEMLFFMAKLAVLAGHPEDAQAYLQQLLWPKRENFSPFRGRETS